MSCEELCGMCSPSCTNYQEGQVLLEKDKLIQDLERQLAEARELLLQVQDHMSQLSSHTHDGWSGSCADTVYEMIENKLKEQG